MYRLTNLTQDKTTTYKNKDLVYQALDRENAKVKHQNLESLLLVEVLDKKGTVTDQEEIFLPFEGIADSLFLQSGTNDRPDESKPKQKRFWELSKVKKGPSSTLKEKEALKTAVSDMPSSRKSSSIIKKWSYISYWKTILVLIGVMTSIVVSNLSLSSSRNQTKQLTTLKENVDQVMLLQSEVGKVDVFARYFLPNYYSKNGKLRDFSALGLELEHQPGQLQSVMLEKSTITTKNTYQMDYVLAINDGEHQHLKRLSLTIEKAPTASYGYWVSHKPKITDYPK